MSDILSVLNTAQREAVIAPDGPVLVVAGAGSGKTRVLTTRIAWLLQQGVQPWQILAFTFTNKAAAQMKGRVAELVGEDRAPRWIGTFHATGARILRMHADRLGLRRDYAIYDADDQKRLLKRILGDLQLDPRQFPVAAARVAISNWKNTDLDPAAAAQAAIGFVEATQARIYAAYQQGLRTSRALDFDDLILETVHLLERDTEIREQYATRFRHVLVDEFQDTNPLQLLLVRLLSSVHGNVFVVGDDDQAIYGWRGARVENMLEFDTLFAGTRTYRLEQNYRSVGVILDTANAVIAHNRRRKGKNLWTHAERGEPVAVEEHLDAEDEAARVVELVQQHDRHSDVVVLYRTNAQSRLLEDALRRARIAHQVIGSVQFYERREIRDLLAYLKLIHNPADAVSLQRIINQPKRKIGATTVARLLACAQEHAIAVADLVERPDLLADALGAAAARRVQSFLLKVVAWRHDAAAGLPVPQLLERIVNDIGYERFLHDDEPESASTRQENVAELISGAYAFSEASDEGTLAQYLEQTALIADQDTIQDGTGTVRLMTVHTAKGLEFPIVILTGCEDSLLPHISSSDTETGVEEERRLFYVAVTRAQHRLYLLHAARRRRAGMFEDCLPSRFLHEIPDHLCHRHTAGYQPLTPVARTLFGDPPPRAVATSRPSSATPPPPARGHQPRTPAGWDHEVDQTTPYYPGQTVLHATFGAGQVVRIEGAGKTLTVTVDFPDHGRKHLLPRLAPLRPVD